jgi:sarcosine oxidase, subunit beta
VNKPAVAVIGAGAVGLSAALHLRRFGADVTVVERASIGGGSSGLSVGIIETQYVDPLDIELRVWSMQWFDSLERDHHLHVVRNGYLRLAHAAEELGAFARSAELQRGLGVADVRVLAPFEIQRLIRDIRCDDLAGGLFGERDGYIDGHLYCNLLAGLAQAHGARVITDAPLLGAGRGSTRKHRLTVAAGALEVDFVVNAAGAWAGEVAGMLGATAAILPQRHQTAIVHLPNALSYVMPSVMDYIPHSGGYGLYFRHDGVTRLIVGLHTEEPLHDVVDPNRYNRSADYTFVEAVAPQFLNRLPGLADAQVRPGWAGLYPMSPDGLPQVGPSRGCDTVIAACGVGGSGLQTSPGVGRLAAEWIVFGEPRSIHDALKLIPSRPSLDHSKVPADTGASVNP